jgi:serine/threonine-protein kinase
MARSLTALVVLAALACGGSTGTAPPSGGSPRPAPSAPVSSSAYFPPEAVWYPRRLCGRARSAVVRGDCQPRPRRLGAGTHADRLSRSRCSRRTRARRCGPSRRRRTSSSPTATLAPVPVPAGGALEGEQGYECRGDGDCHLIVAEPLADEALRDCGEPTSAANRSGAGCLAVWDMTRVYPASGRGEQCTSADAAGLPDRAAPVLTPTRSRRAGSITAVRFILPNATIRRARVRAHRRRTARAATSGPPDAPPYGAPAAAARDYPLARSRTRAPASWLARLQRYGCCCSDAGRVALTARSDRFTRTKWAGLLGPPRPARRSARATSMVAGGDPHPPHEQLREESVRGQVS